MLFCLRANKYPCSNSISVIVFVNSVSTKWAMYSMPVIMGVRGIRTSIMEKQLINCKTNFRNHPGNPPLIVYARTPLQNPEDGPVFVFMCCMFRKLQRLHCWNFYLMEKQFLTTFHSYVARHIAYSFKGVLSLRGAERFVLRGLTPCLGLT